MKYPHEIEQMEATAAALTVLMRTVLKEKEAAVTYNAEEDSLRLESEAMAKTVNTACDNARAAAYDFVEQTLGKLIL